MSPSEECVWESLHFHPLNKLGVTAWTKLLVVLTCFDLSLLEQLQFSRPLSHLSHCMSSDSWPFQQTSYIAFAVLALPYRGGEEGDLKHDQWPKCTHQEKHSAALQGDKPYECALWDKSVCFMITQRLSNGHSSPQKELPITFLP